MRIKKAVAFVILLGAFVFGSPGWLCAQDFPTKPINLVVGYAPGGAADLVGRLLAKELGDKLGQPVIVVNRPGAGTTLAADFVSRARPDGYTLLLYNMALTLPSAEKLAYDPEKSFSLISLVAEQPALLVVNANTQARTLQEFIALAKSKPGQLNFGSTGPTTPNAGMMRILMSRVGVSMQNISYAGEANIMTAILGEEVQSGFMSLSTVAPHVKSGAINALAISTKTRSPQFSETPPVSEVLPDFDLSLWYGIAGPAGLPSPVSKALRDGMADVLARPHLVQALTNQGLLVLGPTQDMGERIRREVPLWAAVMK